MFGLFKKKEKKKSPLVLADVDGNTLGAGDQVLSLRYDLGECTLMDSETGLIYKSKDSGEQVSWVKMIDASTERQKVKKILTD